MVVWCVFGTLFRPDVDPGTLVDTVFEAALLAVNSQMRTSGAAVVFGLGLVLGLLAVVAAPAILANRAIPALPRRIQLPVSVAGLVTALSLTVGAVTQRPEGWTGQLYWRHTVMDELCGSLSCKRSGFLGPGEGVDVSMVEMPLKLFRGPADLRSPTLWLEPQLLLVRPVDAAITYRVAGDLTLSAESLIMVFLEGVVKVVVGLLEGLLLYTLLWSVLMIICTWANPYLLLVLGFSHAAWRVFRDR